MAKDRGGPFSERFSVLLDEQPDLEDFAQRVGVGKTALDHYAAGRRRPNLARLARIAEEGGVSTDWLLGRTEERSLPSVAPQGAASRASVEDEAVSKIREAAELLTEHIRALVTARQERRRG